MKNKIIFLIVSIFSVLFCDVVYASEDLFINSRKVKMNQSEIQNLQNLGFLDSEIDNMTQEEFDNNKNLNSVLVSQDTKYYKTISYRIKNSNLLLTTLNSNDDNVLYYSEEISEEEYNNPSNSEILPQDQFTHEIVNTEYKQMTASISWVSNSYYRYKNSLKWKKEPKTRSNDIISIGIDSTVSAVPSSKTFNMTYMVSDNSTTYCYPKTVSSVTRWESSPNGVAGIFPLPPNSSSYKTMNIEIYMYFNVQKLQTTTINTLNAYGDYKHAQKKFTLNPSFDFGVGLDRKISFGVSVSPSIVESFDSITTSHATASGINW